MATVNLIIPVNRFNHTNLEIPFYFANNIRLIKTPQFLKDNEIYEVLNLTRMVKTKANDEFELSIEILNIDEREDDKRYFINTEKYEFLTNKLYTILLTTWISNRSLFTFSDIFLYQEFKGNPEIITIFNTPLLLQYHKLMKVNSTVLEDVKKILNSIENMKPESRLKLPISLTITALKEDSINLRYILFWMVLESLYGVADAELTFRLSQSISLFLSENTEESGIKLFDKIKRSYGTRGALVHGSDILNKNEESLQDLAILEDWVQKSFNKILLDENLVNTFSSKKKRKEYLENLPYNYQAKKEIATS